MNSVSMYMNWFVCTSFDRYRNVYLHAGCQQKNGGGGRIFRIVFKPIIQMRKL